tara:strand:+ start:322 stop:1062 length:741 start_codon:yes stop_codon:yes gene_type:complete
MPPQTLFKGQRFSDSRDYRGDDFRAYLEPSFYGGAIPNWQGLLIRNQLRTNGELVALNEPELQELGTDTRPQLRGFRVSPQIPTGIYKRNTRANVYYWRDGMQYSTVYYLRSLDSVSPESISNQVLESIYSQILEEASDILRSKLVRIATLGTSSFVANFIDLLQEEVDEADIFGVWVRGATVISPIDSVTSEPSGSSALDGVDVEGSRKINPLPYLISGLGIATGSPVVFGAGLLVSFLERRKND